MFFFGVSSPLQPNQNKTTATAIQVVNAASILVMLLQYTVLQWDIKTYQKPYGGEMGRNTSANAVLCTILHIICVQPNAPFESISPQMENPFRCGSEIRGYTGGASAAGFSSSSGASAMICALTVVGSALRSALPAGRRTTIQYLEPNCATTPSYVA